MSNLTSRQTRYHTQIYWFCYTRSQDTLSGKLAMRCALKQKLLPRATYCRCFEEHLNIE